MADRSLAVRLRAEVDQYRRDMAAAAQATASVGQAAAAAGRQSGAFEALRQAGRSTAQTIGGLAAAGTAGMVALTLATLRTGVSYNTLEQQTRAALTTLLGGTQAATEQMDELREFVRTSLFPREVFIEGQQMLLGFGLAAERVIPTLAAVENAVAATGGTAVQFREIVFILAQMQATGKITAMELRELGNRGLNAAQLIGQAMGKTEGEIRESITAGALDGREALEALVTSMEQRFAGAGQLIRQTWTGARGSVRAALRDIGSALVETFIDPRGGGAAVEWARQMAAALRAFEGILRPLVAELRSRAAPGLAAVTHHLERLTEAIEGADLEPLIGDLLAGGPALTAFAAAAAAAGSRVVLGAIPGLSALTGTINPLGAAILALVATSPELRQVVGDLLSALAPLLPVTLDLVAALTPALSGALTAVAAVLSPIVAVVDDVVSAFAALPQPVQTAVVALMAVQFLAPGIARFGAAMAALPAQVAAGVTALRTASTGATALQTGLTGVAGALGGPWGLAIAGAVTAVSLFTAGQDRASAATETFTGTLDEQTGAATRLTRQLVAQRLQQEGVLDAAERLGVRTSDLVDLVLREEGARQRVVAAAARTRAELEAGSRAATQHNKDFGLMLRIAERLQGQLATDQDLWRQQHDAVGGATDAQEEYAGATQATTEEIRAQNDALAENTQRLLEAGNEAAGLRGAQRRLEAAYDSARESLAKNGATLDITTEAGRDNAEALDNIATSALEVAERLITLDGDVDAARETIEDAREGFIDLATEMGLSRDRAQELADRLGLIPEEIHSELTLENAERAIEQARELERALSGIPRDVRANVIVSQSGTLPRGGQIVVGQHGGPVVGPSGIDRVPALLTAGEHILTREEVQAAGGHEAVFALRAALLGQATRFATGGPVGVPASGFSARPVDLTPHEFMATAVLDIGDGVERVVDLRFRRLTDQLMQGVGAAR